MKQTIISITIFLFSLTAFAQPSALKNNTAPTSGGSLAIKFTLSTDTVSIIIIGFDKEGYLKKQTGKAVRKIKTYENFLQPELTEANYFTDNWTAIKPEDVWDVRVITKK